MKIYLLHLQYQSLSEVGGDITDILTEVRRVAGEDHTILTRDERGCAIGFRTAESPEQWTHLDRALSDLRGTFYLIEIQRLLDCKGLGRGQAWLQMRLPQGRPDSR